MFKSEARDMPYNDPGFPRLHELYFGERHLNFKIPTSKAHLLYDLPGPPISQSMFVSPSREHHHQPPNEESDGEVPASTINSGIEQKSGP